MKGANQNLHEIQSGKTRVKSDQSRLVKKVMRDFPANRSASLARQLKKKKYRIFFVWLSYRVPSVSSLVSLSHLSRVWRTSRRKIWERGCWLSCKEETNSAFLTTKSIWMQFNEPYCMFKIHSVKIDTLPVSYLF